MRKGLLGIAIGLSLWLPEDLDAPPNPVKRRDERVPARWQEYHSGAKGGIKVTMLQSVPNKRGWWTCSDSEDSVVIIDNMAEGNTEDPIDGVEYAETRTV